MKKLALDIQFFAASSAQIYYNYQYDSFGYKKSVEVKIKTNRTGETIESIFLIKDSTGEEIDITQEWIMSQEEEHGVAKKTFYAAFDQTIMVSTSAGQDNHHITGGDGFPPESSKYGIHLNGDFQLGDSDIKISELITLVKELKTQLENSPKLVFSGEYQGGAITASTFTKGYFSTTPAILNSKYLTNDNGILKIQKEGLYRIEWNVRFPDVSSAINVNCGISLDEDASDNVQRGSWSTYNPRGTSTGVIYLHLAEDQTIRPKFWSSAAITLKGQGYYYISFISDSEVS